MLIAAVALALAAAAPGDPAATGQPDAIALAELDGYAIGLTEADTFSGVVLVARHGTLLFEHAYGKRDEAKDGAISPDTRFNLASAGKMFTSVAVLQQIAKGRITLGTKVGEVIRDYPNRAFAESVTVRQLLTHTAGAGGIDEMFGAENASVRQRLARVADMVALHGRRAPAFTPGSKQEYENFGYVVLGRMIELLSGEDYPTYVRRHIFVPAGMTRTSFAACTEQGQDVAIGYATVSGKRVVNCATQPVRGFPAGGQVSTARDMLRFMEALRSGRLIPKSLLAEATKPHKEFMGLGFFATDYGPEYAPRDFRWGHGGSSDGICTDVRHYPRTGETVIVLSNRDPPSCFPVANFLHRRWLEGAVPKAKQRAKSAVGRFE